MRGGDGGGVRGPLALKEGGDGAVYDGADEVVLMQVGEGGKGCWTVSE